MPDLTPCSQCRRPVSPGEAAVSRRALCAVQCAACRSDGRPNPDHERDARLEVLEVGGYGLWHVLDAAGQFVAGGLTREAALYRARLALAR